MKKKLNFIWKLLKETFEIFGNSNAFKSASSLAYSAIFSIPGLLIIVIWLAGYFLGEKAIHGEISRQIGAVMGADVASSIEGLIKNSLVDKDGIMMKTVGIASLVFGATTFFFQLQKSLNELWQVEPAPKQAFVKFLLDRANSLGMILILGFLMMITMVLSSLISYFGNLIAEYSSLEMYYYIELGDFLVGFVVIMVLFALIFKVLPDIDLKWRSIGAGAFFTALLFIVGKFFLSYYFSTTKPTSAFGAAGTLVLIMMWINYTCMLIFIGAAFTKAYAKLKGHPIEPSRHAKWNKEKLFELSTQEKEESKD